MVFAISTVFARPGPDPQYYPAALTSGYVQSLANAGRPGYASSQGNRRPIPPVKTALAAGVGIGLVKAGVLSGALNGK